MPDVTNQMKLAVQIASAYVSNNSVPAVDLPQLINHIHLALIGISNEAARAGRSAEPRKPAVPTQESITDEYLICLEDGRKFRSLKRHLRTDHKLSPEQYREKWELLSDYPMVAPAYAKTRSALALRSGLGQKRRTLKKEAKS
jgi:predicted transcriptional regulator